MIILLKYSFARTKLCFVFLCKFVASNAQEIKKIDLYKEIQISDQKCFNQKRKL